MNSHSRPYSVAKYEKLEQYAAQLSSVIASAAYESADKARTPVPSVWQPTKVYLPTVGLTPRVPVGATELLVVVLVLVVVVLFVLLVEILVLVLAVLLVDMLVLAVLVLVLLGS